MPLGSLKLKERRRRRKNNKKGAAKQFSFIVKAISAGTIKKKHCEMLHEKIIKIEIFRLGGILIEIEGRSDDDKMECRVNKFNGQIFKS